MEITLYELPIGKTGIVKKLNVNESLKRRLQDLGLICNSKIKKLYKSPLNNPCAYLIKDSAIALRNEDAKNIFIFYDYKIKSGDD